MVVVVNQTNRGPGFVDSGTFDFSQILGDNVQPNTNYVCTLILDPADRDDPTLVFSQVTLILDGEVVWGPSDMPCGLKDRNGTPVVPSFSWGSGGNGKATVRITFSASRRVRLGLDVSTTPLVR